MTDMIIPINYIERKPNSAKYRIVGKGVTVDFLSHFIGDPEWTVESICEAYDLTPAEVYSAWAFYYDHQEEIDQNIREAQQEAEQYFADHPEIDQHREDLIRRWEEKTGKRFEDVS